MTITDAQFLDDSGKLRLEGSIVTGGVYTGALSVSTNLTVGGALDHDGLTVGFYGTAPIAKQTGVAVTAGGIHAALVALGLIAA